MNEPEAKRWLTLEQAAAHVGCRPCTIRAAIRCGELPHVRLKGYVVELSDLDRWMQSRKRTYGQRPACHQVGTKRVQRVA